MAVNFVCGPVAGESVAVRRKACARRSGQRQLSRIAGAVSWHGEFARDGTSDVYSNNSAANRDLAGVYFEKAVADFRAAMYESAAARFLHAADLVRAEYSLLAAEYDLWGAQALIAGHHMTEGLDVLHRAAQHHNLNARRAAHTIERAVVTGAKEINCCSFFEIPPFHNAVPEPTVHDKFQSDRPMRPASGWAIPVVEAERYTLEWFKDKKPAETVNDRGLNSLVAIAGLLAVVTLFVESRM